MQHTLARHRKVLRATLTVLVMALPFIFVSIHQHSAHAYTAGSVIVDVNTDKARYNPGDTVTIWVDLTNNTGQTISNGSVTLYYKHLGTTLATGQAQTLNLNAGASTSLSWQWTPPSTNYQGYSVEAWVRDSSNNDLDNLNTAVDVSSDWTKFPRYGFMATYPSQAGSISSHEIWQLKNYHIDGLQFYDWQYKHHIPLAGSVSSPAASWNDIANRTNYRQTVLDYLNAAHGYNMLGFAYNAANAAYADYTNDGVQAAWGIYNNNNCTGQDSWNLPSGWATPQLDLFDPSNSNWQSYIFKNENNMFSAYPFDGWHVDQLVVGGSYTCSGGSINIYDTFPGFLNNAKSSTGKRIIFNDSGNTALSGVSQQTSDDIVYNEWFSGKTYYNFKQDIDYAASLSSKSLATAAYMQTNNPGPNFNTPGILLADAAIFAAGGDHIELGDNLNMLSSDYFPSHPLILSSDLQKRLQNYYDFMVAYEELLRGGLANTSNTVQLSVGGSSLATSTNSAANSVYEFTKSGNGYDTINLINLLGENNNDAFDASGNYPVPNAQSNVSVKYYYGSGTVNSVSFASPDYQNGKTYVQNFSPGSDSGGNYVTFTVPSLAYWDLIYINKSGGTTGGQQLFFDDFENGSSSNWTPYDGTWAVCQVGNNSKEYCGSNTSEDISLAGSSSWSNYNVQSYVVTGGSGNNGICLLGRVQDGNHFYQAELKTNNTWDIWKNNGGSWSQIASGNFSWSGNSYYLIRFDLNGSTLTMSYSTNYGSTWNTLGSGSDSTWSSGKIGLRVWGTTGRFDQVKVISD